MPYLIVSPPGEALCVRCQVPDRAKAARRLIRPHETSAIAIERWTLKPPSQFDAYFRPSAIVGRWMEAFRASGRLLPMLDPSRCDFWKSPARTWHDGGGDCEDFAIFALSLLRNLGVKASLITGTLHGVGHAWVEGHDRLGWFLLETVTGQVSRSFPPGYSVHRYQLAA